MKQFVRMGALVLVLLAAGCSLDLLTKDRLLTFDFSGTTVKVSSNGTEHSIELKPYIAGAGSCDYTVLFQRRRAGFTYVLLDVSSRSTAKSRGPCAQGSEQNLVWLKLDGDFYPQGVKSVLVESCLQNIHGLQGYDRTDNRLTMDYVRTEVAQDGVNMRSRQYESSLAYDNDHPEAGPVVETRELQ
jgi:hypothetical protein